MEWAVLQEKGGKSVFHRAGMRRYFGQAPRLTPRYRWLDPYGATKFIATHRESTALAFLDSNTEIAEVF